jgi:hypothetical protein
MSKDEASTQNVVQNKDAASAQYVVMSKDEASAQDFVQHKDHRNQTISRKGANIISRRPSHGWTIRT